MNYSATVNQPDGDKSAQVASLFDALSTSYDAVGVDFFGPIADELVSHLALTQGETLLDVGCGKGQVLIRAADHLGEGARMMGIDSSVGMLEHARLALDDAGLSTIELRELDAQNPPLPAGSFDVVASSLVLFFIPDPATALRSWRRLLSSSGRVGITTFGKRDARWEAVDSVFKPYLSAAMLDARTSGATGPFATDEGVADLFRRAGFTTIQTWNSDIDVALRDVEHWQAWTMSHGQRAMWQAVPAEAQAEVKVLAAERLNQCFGVDGQIHFTQTVRTTVGWQAAAPG